MGSPLDLAETLGNFSSLYVARGQYERAELICRRALAIRERTLPSEDPHVARSLSDLGYICQIQGRYNDAEAYYRRAISIREKVFGSESATLAYTLAKLAHRNKEASKLEARVRRLQAKLDADNAAKFEVDWRDLRRKEK
jgi:tetratricopeptide (TPR) repeat protein